MENVGEVFEARTTAATNWMAMHGQVDESTHDSSKRVRTSLTSQSAVKGSSERG